MTFELSTTAFQDRALSRHVEQVNGERQSRGDAVFPSVEAYLHWRFSDLMQPVIADFLAWEAGQVAAKFAALPEGERKHKLREALGL